MLNGIYHASFQSNLGDFGGGLFVAENGRLHGGDATYLYLGTYAAYAGAVTADVITKHYKGPKNSIFGSLTSFKLCLRGAVADPQLRLSGIVEGAPHLQITLQAIKVSDLVRDTDEDDLMD